MKKIFMSFILIYLVLPSLAGCKPVLRDSRNEVGSSNSVVASKSQVEDWLVEYNVMSSVSYPEDLDAKFRPENFLPLINSSFKNAVKRVTVISDSYSAYTLPPITDKMLEEMAPALTASTKRVSFSILTLKFWQEVQAAQKSGIKIGILSFDNKTPVSGVYFSRLNYIALDVFAESNTLPHELRHKMQKQSVKSDSNNLTRRILSEQCASSTSQALGEVDATLFDMPYYRGIEVEIALPHLCETSGTCASALPYRYPQNVLFNVSMMYPANAMKWIENEKSCPNDLREIARAFRVLQDKASYELSEKLSEVVSVLQKAFALKKLFNERNCPSSLSQGCEKILSSERPLKASLPVFQTEFRDAFETELAERPTRIRQAFSTLTPELHSELCLLSGGYALLMNCEK